MHPIITALTSVKCAILIINNEMDVLYFMNNIKNLMQEKPQVIFITGMEFKVDKWVLQVFQTNLLYINIKLIYYLKRIIFVGTSKV